MASEIKESESPPSQSQRADPPQSQSAAKLNKVFIFFWHTYSSVMYSLYEIEVSKHLPPPPDKATQADELKNPKKLLPVLQLKTGQYPDGMSCVSLGSKLYFFGGEFNMDNPYIDEDVKKNFKDSELDVFPRQLLILDLSEVGASGDELHKLLVDGEQMRSGKARPHAFVAEEKIYVIGSTIESSISHRSKLKRLNLKSFIYFEVYDPEFGQWHDLPDPPIGNVKTRWVGHAIVRRKALLVAWQGGKERLYCFDLGESRWTDASIPFYPENFSGRTEFVEDTLYGCYHNTIAAIAPVEETKIEKEEKKEKVEAEEGEKMEAEKVKAKETVKAEEEDEDAKEFGQGWLLKDLRLHVLSEEMGMDAIFNVPPQLQSSSSLLHLGNRYFCYVISGMPPNSDNDSDDVIKDDKKRFISIVIFQALGKKYEDGTGLLQAQCLYCTHYEINSPVPNEGFIDGCFFPGSLKEGGERAMESTESSYISSLEAPWKRSPPLPKSLTSDSMEKATYIKFLVSNAAAGSVIGKGDSTITDFQSQSGARIQLSCNQEFFPGTTDRIIMISGAINETLKAVELVLAKLLSEIHAEEGDDVEPRTKVRLIVPNSSCSGIIGKAGSTIKSFIEESQAGIKISPQDNNYQLLNDRLVTVTGTLDEQMRAIDLILSKLAEDPHYSQSMNAPFSYPVAVLPSFATVAHNSKNYGLYGAGGKLQNKEDQSNSVTIGVADDHIGLVVGRGGRIIMEISQISGARIKISDRGDFMSGTSDRKVTITGSQRAIRAAESMIMQKVAYASERVMD